MCIRDSDRTVPCIPAPSDEKRPPRERLVAARRDGPSRPARSPWKRRAKRRRESCSPTRWKQRSERGSKTVAGELEHVPDDVDLSLIHISEPTRLLSTSYAVF